jgi:hypothetical protein
MVELREPPLMAKLMELLLMAKLGEQLMMAEVDPHPHLTTKLVRL